MKNRLSIIRLLVVVLVYLWAAGSVLRFGIGVSLAAVVYVGAAIAIGYRLLDNDLKQTKSQMLRFRRFRPLTPYGTVLLDYQHVFNHPEDLEQPILTELSSEIARYQLMPPLQPVDITDRDRRLHAPETRRFMISQIAQNHRGTELTLALRFQSRGGAQAVQWWVLGEGMADINRTLVLLASAPLRLPFWIYAKMRDDLDLGTKVQTVYDSFYNWSDVLAVVKSTHAVVLDSLCNVLEKQGIDISDLKNQRAQVMNINVSGGRVRFGNVVQALQQANLTQTVKK